MDTTSLDINKLRIAKGYAKLKCSITLQLESSDHTRFSLGFGKEADEGMDFKKFKVRKDDMEDKEY